MPLGFVDIHSHVLYGLDDGAKTLDESVEMLRVAEESGTAHIVATPHANSRYKFRPNVIAARMAELQPLTGDLGRPEDVAGAIVYLATAPFVTGAVLTVDGGWTTR